MSGRSSRPGSLRAPSAEALPYTTVPISPDNPRREAACESVTAFRGEIVDFVGDPATLGDAAHRHFADGMLVVRNGRVAAVGNAADVAPTLPAATAVTDHRGK